MAATWNPAVQVSVTGTAGTLLAAPGVGLTRTACIFRSLSTNTQSVFWGPVTPPSTPVTATTGMELKPGEILTFLQGESPDNLIQAISASGTQVIIVQDAN